jgi:TRAP-type C4-dicarboxylate transport system substrate-binding protein
MSPTQQRVIDDHCSNEWALRVASPWADFERAGVAKLTNEPGHEVYTIPDAQLAEWKQAAQPVVKAWGDSVRKVGGDPDAILKDLATTLAKHNSAY